MGGKIQSRQKANRNVAEGKYEYFNGIRKEFVSHTYKQLMEMKLYGVMEVKREAAI